MSNRAQVSSNILVVEDEAVIALDLKIRLERFGYQVLATVSSGRAALETMDQSQPDLLLTDIHLKEEMDGVEVAAYAQDQHGIPVIFLTAYNFEYYKDEFEALESFGFLSKPFSDATLSNAVKKALGGPDARSHNGKPVMDV